MALLIMLMVVFMYRATDSNFVNQFFIWSQILLRTWHVDVSQYTECVVFVSNANLFTVKVELSTSHGACVEINDVLFSWANSSLTVYSYNRTLLFKLKNV